MWVSDLVALLQRADLGCRVDTGEVVDAAAQ